MLKSKIKPIDKVRPFEIHELFFSTTDHKGLIVSGNDIFVRVSGYEKQDLIGAPHNIIRHPDMPRAVFKLLWDYLLNQKTIAAYVKNMAQDGAYYWVVALATPIPEGFLSIRFKPCSEIFEVVANLYKELLQVEESYGDNWRDGMKASEQFLFETLEKLGFKSYDAFMRFMVQKELNARENLLKETRSSKNIDLTSLSSSHESIFREIYKTADAVSNRFNTLFHRLEEYMNLNSSLENKSKKVLGFTQGFRFISLNTSVRSSKLGAAGASLSVIADYMQESSVAISTIILDLNKTLHEISEVLNSIIFGISCSKLQLEMILAFSGSAILSDNKSPNSTSHPQNQEAFSSIGDLTSAFSSTVCGIEADLSKLHDIINSLENHSVDLGKTITALQCIQVSGVVESCSVQDEKGFKLLFAQVKEQLDHTREELEQVTFIMNKLQDLVLERTELNGTLRQFTSINHSIEKKMSQLQQLAN